MREGLGRRVDSNGIGRRTTSARDERGPDSQRRHDYRRNELPYDLICHVVWKKHECDGANGGGPAYADGP